MMPLLRDIYVHQEWADAEHWRAMGVVPAARESQPLLRRLHHIHQVQRMFVWALGGGVISRWLADDRSRRIASSVLAILLELSVIYYFNAVNKHGWTWRRGLAVYYVLYQERMVTWFGLILRRLMTVPLSRVLSYAVLAIEYAAPVLLLSPFARLRLRRIAIVLFPALHLAFAAGLNLGQFSFNMIGYFPLLLSSEDWDFIARRLAPGEKGARTVYVREESPLAFAWARLLSRLDVFGRLRDVHGMREGGHGAQATRPRGSDRARAAAEPRRPGPPRPGRTAPRAQRPNPPAGPARLPRSPECPVPKQR